MPRPATHPCLMCRWHRMPSMGHAAIGARVHVDG